MVDPLIRNHLVSQVSVLYGVHGSSSMLLSEFETHHGTTNKAPCGALITKNGQKQIKVNEMKRS